MDPAKMKVVDLRSELGALGLDTKGNKPALVERLKKALEAKTGKAIADTTILDTSTEDADEPSTPRRAGPAARTRRRSSSSRVASTPAKVVRVETPEPIEEEKPAEKEPEPEPEPEPETEPAPKPVQPPQPVPQPELVQEEPEVPEVKSEVQPDSEMYSIDDEKSQSPPPAVVKTDEEPMEVQETEQEKVKEKKESDEDGDKKVAEEKNGDAEDAAMEAQERERELTEEEEWEQLNERLQQKEKERLEREKKQAEDDAKRLEEVSKDPVKLNRLKRKQEKKARWSNFYKAVEVTNEVLTPPVEEPHHSHKRKSESTDTKVTEPDINDNKLTLSWYDSDLNQYLEAPELVSVVPLSDGAFAHAWAGARASHGVQPASGRVCYEVRVGSVVTTTETTLEKEVVSSGLRVGWSTDDSTLHLGEGELSFGFESTGRAVNNGEFKEYGKTFTEKDVIGVYLDLDSSPCKISYTLNGTELGVAHEFERGTLGERALFPHVLTKNICYRVNFGDDQYNMLTKTKIVRNRIEVPVEEVLEEKRKREEELKKQREEREAAAKKERERRDRERKEREERLRKKREEREKQERERKEKEAQEKKDKGEDVSEKPAEGEKEAEKETETEKDKEAEKEKETEKENEAEKEKEADKQDEPKENGDKPEEAAVVKQEPMETDCEPAKEPEKEQEAEKKEDTKEEVKEEPVPEGEIPEVTEEQVLKGLTLDKRIKFVTRYTVSQELDGVEACLVPGFMFLTQAELVSGPRRPASRAECEVILMVGMPGSGKSQWARAHAAAHPARRYNLLSTAALFDRMQVDCKPFRASYEGRWDSMLSKGAKCVLKLLEFAQGRRRNYILDQTNVYPSAQRRKLREFEGYKRIAVVVVPDPDTYAERNAQREKTEGKEVPDGAIVDMKANFTLPEKCSWIDEVIYAELNEEEAKKVVEGFHKEARAAGVVKEREKRERSDNRDAPPMKRPRSDDRRHPRDDRRKEFSREREDRWGGGGGDRGGSSRWGPARGGGGRWGPRDRPGPPQGRFDRPWGGRDNNGPPFNRDRDGFRGGRGGHGGPGGPGGPGPGGPGGPGGHGGHGGPMGGRGERGPPRPDQRFGRGPDRSSRPPPQQDKRPGPPAQQGGGGSGSWQRGQGARGAHNSMAPRNNSQRGPPPGKDGQQGQQQGNQQQGWNQWANSGWGGWGNWNQNQAAWGNWGNWNNWNNAQQQQQGQQAGAVAKGQAGQAAPAAGQGQQATQQQWQQWYQWQQWQQQQGWPGYQQGQGNQQQAGQASTQDQQAQWAQYYQNYGANAAANNAVADKK